MKKILTVLFLLSAVTATAQPLQVPPPPQLAPLGYLLGNWTCSGTYLDVSLGVQPITVAHTSQALFHVGLGVGNAWIVGQYTETQPAGSNPLTAPISVLDSLSINPFGVGVRSFVDSHTGQLEATFVIGADGGIEWDGTYTLVLPAPLPPIALHFTEHLTRGAGDATFDIDSRLDVGAGPQTFQTQHCIRL